MAPPLLQYDHMGARPCGYPDQNYYQREQVTIGTFRPEHLQAMYQLSPTLNFAYNAEFLEGFKEKECEKYGINLSNLIRDWISHPAKFRVDSNGIYSVSSLEPPFRYIAMMACRLHGREDTTHFFLPWVPLIHTVSKGLSFDWAKLLSDSLTSQITKY
jgi:hypothetical protein